MRITKYFSFVLLAFIISLFLFSNPVVLAMWQYAGGLSNDSNQSFPVDVSEFVYKPEDVLPDEEYDKAEGNHLVIIRNIISESDCNINDGGKKIIHEYLGDYGVVYGSYNATSGGTLKKALVGQDSRAGNVMFMMTRISDTEYNAYTFFQDDLDDARGGDAPLPDGYIEVYKTVMVYHQTESGEMLWEATRSYIGKAKTGTCPVGEKNKTVYSILYQSWVET